MAVLIDVKRSPIYNEFTSDEQERFFGISRDKVIHNIDTLYYSVLIGAGGYWDNFALKLKKMREDYNFDSDEEVKYCDLVYYPANFSIYRHCLREKDAFDIFIAEKVPNVNTPQIVVQLRSIVLWSDGEINAIKKSFSAIERLCVDNGLTIVDLYENRIDWAFHTNSIQNTTKFFGDKILINNLKSTLTQYQKVGKVGRELTIDYLSLGKRQSNNIFFRAYNKTREVVEMGYKSIFIEIWRKHRLISEYDAYVLKYAFECKTSSKGFESSISRGRIAWYLEYGRNKDIQARLIELRENYQVENSNIIALDNELDQILPKITQICNLEFQTKRHFYRSFGNTIGHTGDIALGRLFWILNHRKLFLELLTRDTVRFVKDKDKSAKDLVESDYMAFWRRVRACKTPCESDTELVRTYERNVNIKRAKTDFASKVATLSVLRGNTDNNFAFNVADTLCFFNDNDINKIIEKMVDDDTGEFAALVCDDFDLLISRKKRQYKFLLDRINEEEDTPPEVPSDK